MDDEKVYYLTEESLAGLKAELETLKNKTIPDIAAHIDSASQQGDLSENAEYHQAREDMSWAHGRLAELEHILSNTQIISKNSDKSGTVQIGSTINVEVNDKQREFTIVGPQEANPAQGLISNESPIGEALIGHVKGDLVRIKTPAGEQLYKILNIT
ncbi:MAG: transcription elongation factor GreA [bacterium]|nr:transcription elongation factor GreA [bacterium]